MCFMNFSKAFFHSKNRKIWKDVKKSIFHLFSIKLNLPSFVLTSNIQTVIFLFSFENRIRKYLESCYKPERLSAKAIESIMTKIILPVLAKFSQVFLETLESIFSHGSFLYILLFKSMRAVFSKLFVFHEKSRLY
jgi:hypothetical protein